jgi:hypothetical protein
MAVLSLISRAYNSALLPVPLAPVKVKDTIILLLAERGVISTSKPVTLDEKDALSAAL